MSKQRMLFYDIETAPIIGTMWQKWETNMVWSIQDWYILCFAYKWSDENQTHVVAQTDFKGYKPGSSNDKNVLKKLHELFDEADVVVAHNGNSFDQKKTNARFLINGFDPPSPYQQVDTKLVARKHFNFTSNKLDDLGDYLGEGRKIETNKDLWAECMAGNPAAWNKMKRYNKQDVILLEKIYTKMLPWSTGNPNVANIEGKPDACPRCGIVDQIIAKGYGVTKTQTYQRYKCNACGAQIRARRSEKIPSPNFV